MPFLGVGKEPAYNKAAYPTRPQTGIQQGCVPHSTPEAEIVAGDAALRTIGLPMLGAFDQITGRQFLLDFRGDNTTMTYVCKHGQHSHNEDVQPHPRHKCCWVA